MNAQAGSGPKPIGKRLAVIGAGPMGLYAAFAAAGLGLEVTVLERERVGSSLAGWGGTRFFSPLGMNMPAAVREALPGLPPDDAFLTGPEMIEQVLLPLSRHPRLYDRIRLRHQVLDVGRAGLARKDFAGHPVRFEKPFRLHVLGPQGEYHLEADLVFDASGAFAQGNALGAGGLAVPGERALEPRLLRRLGDLEDFLAGLRSGGTGRVLLVGHGHSAAHALIALRAAADRNPEVSAVWSFRSRNQRPFRETPDDPLPGRAETVSAANAMAAAPPAFLDVRRASSIASVQRIGEGKAGEAKAGDGGTGNRTDRLRVTFGPASGTAPIPSEAPPHLDVDAIAALTGYHPDLSFLSGLALDLSPATEGTRRLNQVLCGASDCLSVPMPRPEDLVSGEPGFFLLGSKSYGRSNAFLLRDGILHLEMILKHALA
jgi:threonine dehydrogenase-like Zn-dependent dehydrogenase